MEQERAGVDSWVRVRQGLFLDAKLRPYSPAIFRSQKMEIGGTSAGTTAGTSPLVSCFCGGSVVGEH